MDTPVLSLDRLTEMYNPEQDWLFERLVWKLISRNHLILMADQGWGIQEYANELRFQIEERDPDVRTCYMDIRAVRSSASFLELFASTFVKSFPNATAVLEMQNANTNILALPEKIARELKLKIAVFIGNVHLIFRFFQEFP